MNESLMEQKFDGDAARWMSTMAMFWHYLLHALKHSMLAAIHRRSLRKAHPATKSHGHLGGNGKEHTHTQPHIHTPPSHLHPRLHVHPPPPPPAHPHIHTHTSTHTCTLLHPSLPSPLPSPHHDPFPSPCPEQSLLGCRCCVSVCGASAKVERMNDALLHDPPQTTLSSLEADKTQSYTHAQVPTTDPQGG